MVFYPDKNIEYRLPYSGNYISMDLDPHSEARQMEGKSQKAT